MRHRFTASLISLTLCGTTLLASDKPDLFARARAYSENSSVQREWAAAILRDLDLHYNDSILDYGSRDGRILSLLRHRAPGGYHVGYEDNEELLAWAKAKYPTRLSRVEWTHTLPDQEQLFDVILSVNRLYREADPQDVLNQFHTLLRPGGKLHIVGPGTGNVNALSAAFRTVIARLGIKDAGQQSAGDPAYRDPLVMTDLLKQAGFRVHAAREVHSVERFHDRTEAILWTVGSLGIAWNLPQELCQEICELAFEELVASVPDAERPDGSFVLPMWRLELIAERL